MFLKHYILGAFAKLRQASISFVMSFRPSFCLYVCLSVRIEQLGSRWTDFDENLYLIHFRKSVGNIQV